MLLDIIILLYEYYTSSWCTMMTMTTTTFWLWKKCRFTNKLASKWRKSHTKKAKQKKHTRVHQKRKNVNDIRIGPSFVAYIFLPIVSKHTWKLCDTRRNAVRVKKFNSMDIHIAGLYTCNSKTKQKQRKWNKSKSTTTLSRCHIHMFGGVYFAAETIFEWTLHSIVNQLYTYTHNWLATYRPSEKIVLASKLKSMHMYRRRVEKKRAKIASLFLLPSF